MVTTADPRKHDPQPNLEELRRDPAKAEDLLFAMRHANDGWAITVWKNGGYKLWHTLDAKYAEGDPDWLTTIPLPEEHVASTPPQ